MIHLITSENALDDALEWIRADDQVVLAGKALQAVTSHSTDILFCCHLRR
jgi:hypothetical protein